MKNLAVAAFERSVAGRMTVWTPGRTKWRATSKPIPVFSSGDVFVSPQILTAIMLQAVPVVRHKERRLLVHAFEGQGGNMSSWL